MCVFRLLDLLQTVTENVPLEENVPLKFVGESFGLQVQTVMVDHETPLVPDLSSIADSIANNSNMRPPLAKIALPGSAVPSSTALRVSAALHADDSLFQQRNNSQLFSSFTKVGSVIASLTIIRNGQEISDLEDAVRITLGKADQEVKHRKVIGYVDLNFLLVAIGTVPQVYILEFLSGWYVTIGIQICTVDPVIKYVRIYVWRHVQEYILYCKYCITVLLIIYFITSQVVMVAGTHLGVVLSNQ